MTTDATHERVRLNALQHVSLGEGELESAVTHAWTEAGLLGRVSGHAYQLDYLRQVRDDLAYRLSSGVEDVGVPVERIAEYVIDWASSNGIPVDRHQDPIALLVALLIKAVNHPAARVFISHAHNDPADAAQVQRFYLFLRANGIDAREGLPTVPHGEEWAKWITEQVQDDDRVLVVASPEYKRGTEDDAEPDIRISQSEAGIVRELFYADRQAGMRRVLPVVLPGYSADDIPSWLRTGSAPHYQVSDYDVAGAESLLRLLTGQPRGPEPELGPAPALIRHGTWWDRRTHDKGELTEVAQQPPPAAEPACSVNAFVTQTGREDPVEGEPLALNMQYEVICNVGIPDRRSLLRTEDARFPRELLPAGPLELRAVLFVEGSDTPVYRTFELPANGESSEWVRLPLPISNAAGTIHAELGIYYEVAVVHIQALRIPVGGQPDRGGPSARLLYRLSRSFSDLGKLSGRRASMVLTARTTSPAVLVNGLAFAPNAFAANYNAADTAVRAAREQMYFVHFEVQDNKEVSRFEIKGTKSRRLHSKPESEFIQDLRGLANCGRRIFSSLFRDNLVASTVAQLMRQEAEGHNRPPIIQVIDLGSHTIPIPWALVYDLPIGGTPTQYELCPSIKEFGPANALLKSAPARCPYEDRHRVGNRWKPDQLCPWRFWGLSTAIEHPPYVTDRDLEMVVNFREDPVSFLVADDPGLDANLRRQHISALEAELGTALAAPSITCREDLARQLADETMDVVYLYCHCGYDKASPSFGFDPSLQLGSFQVTPLDVDEWAGSATWPDPHWPARHPLVVINGCHTAELVSGSLTSFVDAFTNRAAAAGLIGTEITVDQGIAGWAMEQFLMELHRGEAVGAALRNVRWTMLNRGNLMGLAYTPYCLAGLTLRPPKDTLQKAALT